jgi:hypothetical protein
MSEPQETDEQRHQDRVARLIAMALELTAEIEELAQESGHQFTSLARTAKRNRVMIWCVIAGGVLDLVLTAVLGFIGVGMQTNTDRIDALTHRLDVSQTSTRQKVLCPLYQLLKDTGSPEARAAAPDKKVYDHNYKVINDGYNALDCIELKGKTP